MICVIALILRLLSLRSDTVRIITLCLLHVSSSEVTVAARQYFCVFVSRTRRNWILYSCSINSMIVYNLFAWSLFVIKSLLNLRTKSISNLFLKYLLFNLIDVRCMFLLIL